MTRSRSIGFRRAPGLIATLAAAGLVISGAGCGSSPKATHALAIEASADPAATTSTTTATATAAVSAPTVSIVAQAAGPNVKVYDAPDAATPARTLTNPDSSGAALV